MSAPSAVHIFAAAVAALVLLSSCADAVKKSPPPPSPSPPPRPPAVNCQVTVTYSYNSQDAAVSVTSQKATILADQVNFWFQPLFPFAYDNILPRTLIVSASVKSTAQLTAARKMSDSFDSPWIRSIFAKLGDTVTACGDSLILTSTCSGVQRVNVTACAAPAFKPTPIPNCNIVMQLTKTSKGLTMANCEALSQTLVTLYGTNLLFDCSSVSDSGDSFVSKSMNNYNNQISIDQLYFRLKTNMVSLGQLATTYGLQCNVDKLYVISTCMKPLTIAMCSGPEAITP